MYRIGFPGWKIAARIGVPLQLRVDAFKDDETGTYWAKSDDLDGLVVSGATLEELHAEVVSAASALLEAAVAGHPKTQAAIRFNTALPCAA
jgi:predicted RNase H-like HicB family nuclease